MNLTPWMNTQTSPAASSAHDAFVIAWRNGGTGRRSARRLNAFASVTGALPAPSVARRLCSGIAAGAVALVIAGCATTPASEGSRDPKSTGGTSKAPLPYAAPFATPSDPYPSTYKVPESPPTLIRGGTVLTGTGERLDGADVLIVEGRIQSVGRNLEAPANARIIDAQGRWVTPGLIDIHSHLGVYPSPSVSATQDGNEMTAPVTANVWAEHSVWPMDPGFTTALAGGVTSMQILPGSANLMGGRGVVLKNVPSVTYQGMKFPGAPYGLKMACGENPKRVYGRRNTAPSTRMGNMAGYRAQWIEAQEYLRDLEQYDEKRRNGDKDAKPPRRDLRLDTLAGVLKGEILVQMHCYRAEELAEVIDMSREFGYRIAAFHHAVEAYKVSNLLAENGICGALWADWWGFKMEAYDGVQENIAFVDAAPGGCAIVHSDSEEGIQRLNQEAAKAMARGVRAGLDIPPERAIRWITANPARALGILDLTGTLEPGKMADVVVWSGNPFSVYTLADLVFIDGALRWDRANPDATPRSDFMLGQPVEGTR
jgi:imidazolonepropionase-like amidohydrolase